MALTFTGAFESGQVAASGNTTDGFLIQTLNGAAYVGLSGGGAGPSSGYDTRVVASETLDGEAITPRTGTYFMRSQIFFTKDYSVMPFNGGANKARSTIAASHEDLRVPFDTEKYIGFSIRTPLNYWHETGVRDDRGSIQLLSVFPGTDTQATFISLAHYVKSPSTKANWYLWVYTDATSISESNAAKTEYDLGEVEPDIGKWTDFVIRYRANPFATSTNPSGTIAGSKNATFAGNVGIFQLWKGTGAVDGSGNRTMSLLVDRVNEPVGLVPKATDELQHSWRIYKYGWHNNATASTNPVWFGFDAVRMGSTFAEVSPSQLDMVASGAELTAMNSGAPLDASDGDVDYSGTALNAVISGRIKQGGTSQALPSIIADYVTFAGGKFATGDLSVFTTPNVTVEMDIAAPATVENIRGWTTLFATKADYAISEWGLSQGVTVSSNGQVYSCIHSGSIAVLANEVIKIRFAYKVGTSSSVDLRVLRSADNTDSVLLKGTAGSLALTTSGISFTSVRSFTEQALGNSNVRLVTLTFTAANSENYILRMGPNSATVGHTVIALLCAMWRNETIAAQVTFDTTLNIADVIAPTLSGIAFTSVDGVNGRITVTTDETPGDGWAVVTTSATPPTPTQVRTGLDHTGVAAMWGGYSPVTSTTITWTPSGLTKAANKYAHVYHVDGAGNESAVSTSTVILGDTTTKKFVWSAAAGNAIYCYNAVSNTFTPFTGNMAVTITTGDWFAVGDDVTELAYAPIVAFVSGEAEMVEADLSTGSINALLTGAQGYNYWATDGTCRADNAIQLTVE